MEAFSRWPFAAGAPPNWPAEISAVLPRITRAQAVEQTGLAPELLDDLRDPVHDRLHQLGTALLRLLLHLGRRLLHTPVTMLSLRLAE